MKPPSESGCVVRRPVLITGGAGFIGTNLAHRLLSGGNGVIIFDNLARPGVERNLAWLRAQHRERLNVVVADVRDEKAIAGAVRQAGQVFHFAGHGSAAASLADPVTDFEVNARGTLNVLEGVRRLNRRVSVLFASTHAAEAERCDATRSNGSDEPDCKASLSPHACSKAAAEQYVLSYAQAFGVPATVLRLSTIYGPHSSEGVDDWVAHALLRALQRVPIVADGEGAQVRDVLYVEDLVDAMIFAQANIASVQGRAFNVGGGAENAISLMDLISLIAEIQGEAPAVAHADAVPTNRRPSISDLECFSSATGWNPRVAVHEGIRRLYRWLIEHRVAQAEAERISPPSVVFAAGRDIALTAKKG